MASLLALLPPILAGAAALAAPPPVPVPKIPFAPRAYLCLRADTPPTLDGRLDDALWAKVPWTEDFVDIDGPTAPRPRLRTRVKMAWDDACLYVAAELEEPDVWAYVTGRDEVIFQDNDFEIFVDPAGTTSPYFEFEMNARNSVWDLLLLRPYRELGGRVAVNGWDIRGLRTATAVEGTLNHPGDRDRGWTLEVALPWAALGEVAEHGGAPRDGERWRINFSRVEWRTEVRDGRYVKVQDAQGRPLPEDNWVWSPQGVVNMHYPEMWGFLQFSALPAGAPGQASPATPRDRAQWALRRVYYAQRRHLAEQGRYAPGLEALVLGDLQLPAGWTLRLEPGASHWMAEIQETATGLRVRMDPDGRLLPVAP